MPKFRIPLILLALTLVQCSPDSIATEAGFADVNGTRLYYEVTGQGEPLVLVHGWSFDTRSWEAQISDLSRHFKVLCYDLRGFGKSALPVVVEPYSHTDDLVALLDHLGLGRVHLAGHSFGGRIAIDFAMKYPERVHGLILPDGAVDLVDLPLSEELLDWIGGTWQAGRETGVERAKEIWLAGSPLAPALQNPQATEQVRQMVGDYTGWHWENQDPYVGIEPYRREDLSRISAPTLVILGLLNPPYYHEVAAIQDEYIPNSTLVSMAGVGHALSLEAPEEFNRILLEFLTGLEAPGADD